jgi:hypothetical protein
VSHEGLPLGFWLLRQREALADVAFRLLLVYAACAVCYLIFPVVGPAPLPPVADAVRHGAFFEISAAVVAGLLLAGLLHTVTAIS